VPARNGVVPQRAAVPVGPCLHRARAWPSAQGTARGPFGRAVPPVGHGHFHRAGPAYSPTGKKNTSKKPPSAETLHFQISTNKRLHFHSHSHTVINIHIHTQL